MMDERVFGWFGCRAEPPEAEPQPGRSRNESHCFIGIPEIADRLILNVLSSMEGPSTALRKPYLNTTAPSPWSHCGESAEVTPTKQFWFRMQLHKASIPLVLGSGPPGGRFV